MPDALPTLEPMLPQSAPEPFDREGWLFEPKLDGMRLLVYLEPGRPVRMLTRRGIDRAAEFPALAALVGALPCRAAILDTEMASAAEQPPASGYRVRWEIDLDAPESPIAAAIEAQQIMRDPASIASVFAVTTPDGKTELVHLLAHDSGASLRGGDV